MKDAEYEKFKSNSIRLVDLIHELSMSPSDTLHFACCLSAMLISRDFPKGCEDSYIKCFCDSLKYQVDICLDEIKVKNEHNPRDFINEELH